MIRFAKKAEVATWDQLIGANPDGGAVLQGKQFLAIKQWAGWTPRYIVCDSPQRALSVMEKTLPLLGKVWYAPKGPSTISIKDLSKLLDQLVPFAKKQGVFSLKIEPELSYNTDIRALPMLKQTLPIQYNFSTVLIDLQPNLDDILKSLPQKGRHAIRRAERDGVIVKQVKPTDKNCRIMYDLFTETAEGAHFAIRPPEYYQQFYREYGENGGLFFAFVDDTPVAGAFAMVVGQKSMYKDGASTRKRQVYGASHLLQWKVIEWAKSKGSLEHDLAGIPPINRLHDHTHSFYGMGRFKTSFNKTPTQYLGTFNIAVRPIRGWLWQEILERVWRRIYFKINKEGWY
ncbi:MAG TPA: peptidoglycan bridge formation glycyltransferase FemA/FemB family protein [Candidatus Saccharibacteria bacterium]|nr:peptidoglycan bridge formation glycyltransferase FemA/FemB family protein [Candidatus Saccharibacteria bacterium]HMR37939.1 peptidoglycan bridge formation glycyltransferase FemA/FemB family protein [Candidatus Saccharibacteria bacterium]